MGNNHSTNIDDPPVHTDDFLNTVRQFALLDDDVRTMTQRWQKFVMACYYLAANLRCQWFSKRAPVKPDGEELWSGAPVRDVHDGAYATLLVYAGMGMSIESILRLPHIKDEMEKHGLPRDVCKTIVLSAPDDDSDAAVYHVNDWLLAELDLKAEGVGTISARRVWCGAKTPWNRRSAR